ncbi:MAG: hypothetical protein ACM3ZV_02460 [Bacillota bacterium]
MNKLLLGCSVSMLTIAAAPVSAAPQLAQNTTAPTVVEQVASNSAEKIGPVSGGAVQPQAEKKVCKLLDSSYSHVNKRVCLTAKEWGQVEREAR